MYPDTRIYQWYGRYKSIIEDHIARETHTSVLSDDNKKICLGFITMQKNVDKVDEEKRIFPRILFMLMVELISKYSFAQYMDFGCIPKSNTKELEFYRSAYFGRSHKECGVSEWKPFGRKNKMDDEVIADLKSIMNVYNKLK